ncbi:NTP pyrophosphohydrolase [Yinghuangia seranimata]|uniref:NTP pyrophosphohydrolase n=1 Tax=Yinghuangia seranimata TaxID=408067 RepID=UPI00248C02A2|nr:NTP pyrophosphohydrolase [Yinghuangia seranimata]MDI2130646.1 NTP pyrophosphohydrolase [Yinghuangia seranimata]
MADQMPDDTTGDLLPLVVVDAANVVGSVPDGWWKNRRAAAERLRDSLAALGETGLPTTSGAPPWAVGHRVEVLLVVEGAARGVESIPGVRVISAKASGDDEMVEVVTNILATTPNRPCLVVTADRGLRTRVTALGAEVIGPRSVRPR